MTHKITYKLHPNPVRKKQGYYRAMIEPVRSLDLKDIIAEMEFRHSSLTPADMVGLIQDFNRTVIKRLLEGDNINTGLIIFSLSLRGNFIDEADKFDANRHKLRVCVKPTCKFQRTVKSQARLTKKAAVTPTPQLHHYHNQHGSDPDTVLTPTYTAKLKGRHLAFDQSDPRQGLFIVPVKGASPQTAEAIRVEHYSLATKSQLIFRVPDDVPPGDYMLEMRAIFGVDDLRSGSYHQSLQVR
ncbi:MAG: DUF4469 domain-containing protein [Anaerolineae bacterium]|nr:DUF4469 domain-containing protein [Anaerolineae bacterium]